MPPFLLPKRGRKAASKRARKGKKRAEGGGRSSRKGSRAGGRPVGARVKKTTRSRAHNPVGRERTTPPTKRGSANAKTTRATPSGKSKRPRISKAEYRRRAAKAAKTRAKNKRAKAKRAAARKPGKGTGSKTRLPPIALWPSPNRSKSLPLLAGKPSAGETFEVVAILAMDQSVSTTSKGGEEGAKWISDRFFLGKMTIAEALSMDAETILGRYRAAWGSKRRGKATRVLALLRPKKT